MREVEIKAGYQSVYKESLIQYLSSHGFIYESAQEQIDRYYNHPIRDFAKTDEALRIRTVRDLEHYKETSYLTYKGKNQSTCGQTRAEYECEIAASEIPGLILEKLGFLFVAEVCKERIVYRKGEVAFCMDEVRGLGSYFEVEIICQDGIEDQAQNDLLEIIKELSFVEPWIEAETYLDLLLKLS